jgi:hypothetical protein
MPFLSRRLFAATVLCGLALLSAPLGAEEHPTSIHVHDAYARINPAAQAGAVFFLIHNGTGQPLTLIGAETPVARLAELHTHVAGSDGMMQMIRIEGGVTLDPGASHEFARGGDHVMLMGLSEIPADGATVPLTLLFDGAEPMTIEVVVDNARMPMSGHDIGAVQPSN